MEIFLATSILIIIVGLLFYYLMVHSEDSSSIPYAKHGHYPIVGHLFVFLRDRTKFLMECYERYGTCFKIQILNQHFTLILSPTDWPNIMRNPALYFPAGDHVEHLFDACPASTSLYRIVFHKD